MYIMTSYGQGHQMTSRHVTLTWPQDPNVYHTMRFDDLKAQHNDTMHGAVPNSFKCEAIGKKTFWWPLMTSNEFMAVS